MESDAISGGIGQELSRIVRHAAGGSPPPQHTHTQCKWVQESPLLLGNAVCARALSQIIITTLRSLISEVTVIIIAIIEQARGSALQVLHYYLLVTAALYSHCLCLTERETETWI